MSGLTWLASYPKSGNTWLRVFLTNLRSHAGAPADINRLHSTQFAAREVLDRAIGWETADLLPTEFEALRLPAQEALAREAEELPIKTHEVFADPRDGRRLFSLTATRGALYVVRNPLDVAVSLSHFWNTSVDTVVTFMNDERAELKFEAGGPQVSQLVCDWSAHVRSWVDAPGLEVCVLRYEDMLGAPLATFARAARAVGFPCEGERLEQAVEHSRFERLQRQEAEKGFVEGSTGRPFFHRGRSGGWREKLTARQVDAIVDRHGEVMRRFGYASA